MSQELSASQLLSKQVLALGWLRCCMEEGVHFHNKKTGLTEKNERVVYEAMEAQTGEFDLPNANVSTHGLEKNILEVIGGYLIFNQDEKTQKALNDEEFKKTIQTKLDSLRQRDHYTQ